MIRASPIKEYSSFSFSIFRWKERKIWMKLIKKILSVFLCLTVIIGSLSVGSFSVSAASVKKGTRGANGKGFI